MDIQEMVALAKIEGAIKELQEAADMLHGGEARYIAYQLEINCRSLNDFFISSFYEEPIAPYMAYKHRKEEEHA